MKHNRCIMCGDQITKSARFDPYLCRECGYLGERNYLYLDGG